MRGSFHDIAAHQYFQGEETELLCCATFEQLFLEMERDEEVVGLVAIENTIAGSLLHNYELLRSSHAIIVGEHKLHIRHSICCLPEDSWQTLTEVCSHPVALMQCRDFLSTHPALKAVEAEDTAGAAAEIANTHRLHTAAICHADAARLYDMKVLEDGIEDNKHNFTRFLIVAMPGHEEQLKHDEQADKASLVFSLPHEEGSLSKVLTILSFYGINLTKIQSLPIIGHEWQYLFYVDLTFHDRERFSQSIDAIRPLTQDLRLLGLYKEA